jgi:phage major head subunit gpT-like protein
MESRGTWTDLIAGVGLEIAEVFDLGQEQYTPGIGEILTATSGEGAERNFTGKTGLGELFEFDEGDDIPLRRRYKTYTTKVTYNNYGNAVQVTKNNIEDRDFDAQLDEMKDLSVAANYAQDKSGTQLFNGGFATTKVVNGYTMTFYNDGVPTYSTVHPTVVPGASTQSNASSTGITFGHDNLETAHVALVEQQTDDGLALALLGKPRLVLPPTLKREGMEETMSELDPETAENAINVFRGGVVDMAVNTHLGAANGGSDTAWFLVVPGRDKQYHETRQGPTLESDVDILSKSVTFTVDARWANYVKDWRRKWGSKGDAQAYSS